MPKNVLEENIFLMSMDILRKQLNIIEIQIQSNYMIY